VSLFILVIVHQVSVGWNKKRALNFANFDAIAKVTRQTFFPKSFIPLILRLAILVCLIFSVSGLGIWYQGYASDFDYILLVDASGSMLADDYEPNRLEAAKEAAIDFIDLLSAKTNIGVISFAGTSFINQPLTEDKSLAKNAISSIEILDVGGTAMGDAVVLASNVYKMSEDTLNGRSVILLTDGQSNVGVEINDAIEYAVDNGIVINTLGVGTEEGGVFIEGLIVSQLDVGTLETLATETGGEFHLVRSKEELSDAYFKLSGSKKTRVFFDGRVYFLLIAFVFLLVEWSLANTKYKTIT
jgi:Ca-activated chloride channel homolog